MLRGLALKILVFFCIVQLTGCSARRLLISNSRFFFIRGIDQYLDLDGTQESDLGPIYDKHVILWREGLIPEATKITDDAGVIFSGDPTPEALDAFFARVEGLRQKLVMEALDDVGGFLASIRPGQLDYLEEQLKESNKSQLEELALDAEKYADVKRDGTRKMLERWFGDLGSEQDEILNLFVVDKNWASRNFTARIRFQENLVKTMRLSMGSKASHKKWLGEFAVSQEKFYGDENRNLLSDRRVRIIRSLIAFSKIANHRQKIYFKDSMRSLAADLKRI